MKTIDYAKLLSEHKPDGYASEDAISIANTLITDHCIQSGYGLNKFLGIHHCFENYQSLRMWVQTKLDAEDSYHIDDIRCELERHLYQILPQLGQV